MQIKPTTDPLKSFLYVVGGWACVALAVLAFIAVGAGVGAAGTSLLALLATRVAPRRRAPAATIVWLMMIFGFVVTTALAGRFLDPYSPQRLLAVTGTVCGIAMLLALAAIWGMEPATPAAACTTAHTTALESAASWCQPSLEVVQAAPRVTIACTSSSVSPSPRR
jgi:MFS family permease